MQSLAVFNFTFAKIVKIWLPLIVLFKIFGGVLRNQNVAGVTAIHHSLGGVNSSTTVACSFNR
jgi:hypothetical protein